MKFKTIPACKGNSIIMLMHLNFEIESHLDI